MSSIRPLATITVLAAAGIFLYLKINETEPVLPAEVAGFEFEESLEFGTQIEATPGFSTQARAFDPSAAGDSTPAFAATQPAEAAPAFNPGVAVAPAFNAAPVAAPPVAESVVPTGEVSEAAPPFAAAPGVVETEAMSPAVPDLPPASTDPLAAQSVDTTPPADTVAAAPPYQPVPVVTGVVENTTSPVATSGEAFPTTPTTVDATTPVATPPTTGQTSLFAATRTAVEAALDRGQLSQALLLLSDWYEDPSLSPQESQEVEQLLSQLAGSVIYSKEHRLEPPYMVQEGESLQDIAARHQVPWQLLAKINSISSPDQLQTGQQLKVIRGPFSATVDLSKREVTLMLNRRYAGKFSIDVDPATSIEEGHWSVNQKLVTPGNVSQIASAPVTPTEEHSLILSNTTGETNQLVMIRGATTTAGGAAGSTGRVLRLSSADAGDVYNILSLGSEVTIRR